MSFDVDAKLAELDRNVVNSFYLVPNEQNGLGKTRHLREFANKIDRERGERRAKHAMITKGQIVDATPERLAVLEAYRAAAEQEAEIPYDMDARPIELNAKMIGMVATPMSPRLGGVKGSD